MISAFNVTQQSVALNHEEIGKNRIECQKLSFLQINITGKE